MTNLTRLEGVALETLLSVADTIAAVQRLKDLPADCLPTESFDGDNWEQLQEDAQVVLYVLTRFRDYLRCHSPGRVAASRCDGRRTRHR